MSHLQKLDGHVIVGQAFGSGQCDAGLLQLAEISGPGSFFPRDPVLPEALRNAAGASAACYHWAAGQLTRLALEFADVLLAFVLLWVVEGARDAAPP